MQVTVTVPDDLAAQAKARGLSLEVYVQSLVQQAAVPPAVLPRKLSKEQFNAALDSLAKHSEKIPDLPIEAFSRESFYQDRD